MTTGDGDVEAGWYRQQDGRERYWDGDAWTDEYRAGDEPPPDPADRSPKDLAKAEQLGEQPGQDDVRTHKLWLVLVVVVLVSVLTCCGWVASLGDDEDSSSGAALRACEDAVRNQVKNPSTAKFPILDTNITDTSIWGEVTAQNDFGAEKTLQYDCTMSGSVVTDVTVDQL